MPHTNNPGVWSYMVGAPGLIVSDLSDAADSFPGQLGSIPLAPTRMFVQRTPARQSFNRYCGDAVFQLNTAIVGLEQIAAGSTQHNLTIKWPVPTDLRSAANQSRRLLLGGVLILVHSRFDSYLQETGNDRKLQAEPDTRRKICKQIQKSTGSGKSEMYSVFERSKLLMAALGSIDEAALAFVDAASVWRNSIVHKNAHHKLNPIARGYFNRHAASISNTHAGIDVQKLVGHLESGGSYPTLKEATTMIAFLIKAVAIIDNAFIASAFATEAQLESYAIELLRDEARENPKSLLQAHAAGKRKFRARLLNVLSNGGFRVGGEERPSISSDRILTFADMSRKDLQEALGLGL